MVVLLKVGYKNNYTHYIGINSKISYKNIETNKNKSIK